MPDELLQRLRRFHDDYFPGVQDRFQTLVHDGQHPSILFIGCSDSRLVPYLLTHRTRRGLHGAQRRRLRAAA